MALNLVFSVTDERTLGPGTILAGKYRVERVLGTGGMGVVVAAIHEQLDERVAVKLLRSDRLAQPEAVERVLREARATVKIQSDHVVRVFDVGTLDDGAPYIVMEYLAGCDLAQLLCGEGRLAIEDATSYVRQACDAIAKAHALGIVHRDLKPANLFLAVRDDVACIKVLDFGISKLMTGDRFDPALTGAAAVLGSPTYMSPEQIASPREVDGRTDVWSLGVILYELLTGAHPFVGETFALLARQITDQPAPSVRGRRPDASEALDAIVARCLAKHRDDRFPDVGALAEALAPLARTTDRRSPPALARTSAAAAASQFTESRPARSEQGAKLAPKIPVAIELPRSKRRVAIAGLAGIAAIGAVAAFGMSRGESHVPAAPASSLLTAGSVLACPQLDAHGVDEPAAWLGAAASTIACARAQARMGGHSARTLIPAELLELPRMPVDRYPDEPFAAGHARTGSIAQAKSRAAAWLDGEIVRENNRFRVTLVLRASDDDRELGRGTASHFGLIEAVRAAMSPFEHEIPSAKDNDPFLLEWLGARTPDAAVAVTDLNFILNNEDSTLECASVQKRTDLVPAMQAVVSNYCTPAARRMDVAPPRDPSSPGALRMSIEADGHPERRPIEPDLALLDAALAKTTDHEERALLLAEKAQVLAVHHLVDRGTEVGLAAIREDPKALDVLEPAWVILSWLRSDSNLPPAATAWIPWSAEAYCMVATQTDDPAIRIRSGRRDHVLMPDVPGSAPGADPGRLWTIALIEFLVADGKRDEARTVAAETSDAGPGVLLAASDGKFAKALDIARDALPRYAADDPYGAFHTARFAGAVALVLDRPAIGIDELVTRYLAPQPSLAASDMLTDFEVAYACAMAPRDVAKRCFVRLREIAGGPIANIDGLLDGAEKFSQGDYAGAALAWRPMLARPGWQLDTLRDLLAIACERSGQDELLERVDRPLLALPGRYNGAELAFVRAARREDKLARAATTPEAKRAHTKQAIAWARRVIDAWSIADAEVPAVAEMSKMLARLQ